MAATPLQENSESRRFAPPRLDGDAASDASSSPLSREHSERRDVDMMSQALSTRSEEYRLLFRLPPDEVLLQDFNCALQENILLQGHMYLFIHHICFYSNIFGFETKKIIPFHEVTCVRKAKTVAIFPNAIEIVAGEKKHFFGSFLTRDEAYRLIVDCWVQHGGDITVTDIKSEVRSQESTIFEKVQESKSLGDDSTSSKRNKDASVLEEIKSTPNGTVENNISTKLFESQENEGDENANPSPSQISFIWTVEDIDSPTVPQHFTIVAESKLPVLVEDFFDLFVSDSAADFLKDFHRRCGDKDFQCTSWCRHEQFGYTRNVSFLHPVKVYLGAKCGSCQEVQKFRVYRNSHLMIETSQHIRDVPFGDYFEVQGIWDVVQDINGENGCTVKVYNNVAFSKKTLFRGKIEQSTRDECREVYATWMSMAHEVLKDKNIGQLNAAGISEENTCMIQENHNEAGSPLEVEESIENPTLNSTNHTRNIHETTITDSGIDENVKAKSEKSLLLSILRESWEAFLSYIRTQSLFPLVLAVAFILFILMQLSIILLLTRVPEVKVPEVHLVPHGNYMSGSGIYNAENIEWLEKRFNYLKEEMLTLETRMNMMRHEYALLKSHLRSLERLKAKS
ncbi:protein VASCULAR ASSOCIATED DEATH 1, chloroplastic-like isoform X3 [Canna indica]|uniref:Protein VASCULAR ASSOCIATED DEATH 1, chloroplastic-like isoform X3 n=1 Tax=Canna indica TaxID=4628 RepID=A0AAQ3QJJ8_9LILI|nr:protein VASCULAR ASSOCIATED DEATH 1, chloroplastic-like isoform X3 [Canna indica]